MRRFDELLDELNDMMLELSKMVENSITMACKALVEQDIMLAKNVIEVEDDINQMEKDIESLCLKLLLQQQPVARDLRVISAALKIITDLERIGDQAADISEIVISMHGKAYAGENELITRMSDATIKMVINSIDAYVRQDIKLAEFVIMYDDTVDELFDRIKLDLIELIRSYKPESEQAIDLLMVAKYFERIGDHACNVAEWVVYSITGQKA